MWVLLLELIGVGLLLTGVALWSVPAGLVLAGAMCLAAAFSLSRVKGEK
jgi:hypothetical protein